MFVTPLTDYDVLLQLDASKCPRHWESLSPAMDVFENASKYRNIALASMPDQLLVGFDPIRMYVAELEYVYGNVAWFFHDVYGGRLIGIKWKPGVDEMRRWRVALDLHPEFSEGGVKLNKKAVISEMTRLGQGLVGQVVQH